MGVFRKPSDEFYNFIDNQMIYQYYRNRLISMALSQFAWDFGDITTCDARYLEKKLLFSGQAALMQPVGLDEWLSLGFTTQGDLNVYGYPTDILGVGYNAANIRPQAFQLIYDNRLHEPIICYIDLYARLLWETHMAYRSNLLHQHQPIVFKGSKNQELSFKKLQLKLTSFIPFIMAKRQEDIDNIQVLNTDVPFKGKELLEALKMIWAEAIAMLGIAPSSMNNKRERMIDREVTINYEEVLVSRNTRELCRKEACIDFNRKYGHNIKVGMITATPELYEFPMDMFDREMEAS